MLTEQQVRETFARLMPHCQFLDPEPLHESCIWMQMTQAELESQIDIIMRPPSFENEKLFSQGMIEPEARLNAAIARGEISRYVSPQTEEQPLQIFTKEELLKMGYVLTEETPPSEIRA